MCLHIPLTIVLLNLASYPSLPVGSLKVTSNTIVLRCSRHGGAALGARMNLFDRLARVIKVSFRKHDKTSLSLLLQVSFYICLPSEFQLQSAVICKCDIKFC